MQALRTIVIREYLPGYSEVECEGHMYTARYKEELRRILNDLDLIGVSYITKDKPVDGYNGGPRPWGSEEDVCA